MDTTSLLIFAIPVCLLFLIFAFYSRSSSKDGSDDKGKGKKGFRSRVAKFVETDDPSDGPDVDTNGGTRNDGTVTENLGDDEQNIPSDEDDDGDYVLLTLSQLRFGSVTNKKKFKLQLGTTLVEIGRGDELTTKEFTDHYQLYGASREVSHSQCVISYSDSGIGLYHNNKTNANTYIGSEKVGRSGVELKSGTEIRMGNDKESVTVRVEFTLPGTGTSAGSANDNREVDRKPQGSGTRTFDL